MSVILHPKFVERETYEGVVHYLQTRGYDAVLVNGSRFLRMEPKPCTPLVEIKTTFRPQPQRHSIFPWRTR